MQWLSDLQLAELGKLVPASLVNYIDDACLRFMAPEEYEYLDESPGLLRIARAAAELQIALLELPMISWHRIRDGVGEQTRGRLLRRGTSQAQTLTRGYQSALRMASMVADAADNARKESDEFHREIAEARGEGKRGRPLGREWTLVANIGAVCLSVGISPSEGSDKFMRVMGFVWSCLGKSGEPTHAIRTARRQIQKSGWYVFNPSGSGKAFGLRQVQGGKFEAVFGRADTVLKEFMPGLQISLVEANLDQLGRDS
jgi:hypothetical protein